MSGIRPLRPEDLPDVATLRRESFASTSHASDASMGRYLELIFLENPWRDPELPSLVHEDDHGRIRGFLGVVPRPFRYKGRSIRGAVTTQFMVSPSDRGLVGVQLVRRAFAGPQDLLLADIPNRSARKMWVGLGGSAARVYGFEWMTPLRPMRHLASRLGMAAPVRAARLLARPFLALGDYLATRLPGSPYRPSGSPITDRSLPLETICEHLPTFAGSRALQPHYDSASLAWLMERCREKWGDDRIGSFLALDEDGAAVGWTIYVSRTGGVAQVLQVAAAEGMAPPVLERLRARAWKEGALALRGRLFPGCLSALAMPGTTVRYDGKDVLVHSRDGELREAVLSGEAFLSGLEGEWWMNF